jgi:hypothetical protein
MRILLVDKNLVDPINHAKWARLSERPGVSLTAVTPERWVENFRPLRFDPARPAAFPIEPLPVVWPGYENRGFYLQGLGGAVRRAAPEAPYSSRNRSASSRCRVYGGARHAPKAGLSSTRTTISARDGITLPAAAGLRPSSGGVMHHAHLLLTANEEEGRSSLSAIRSRCESFISASIWRLSRRRAATAAA